MTQIDRRRLLALGAASMALPAAIQKAWAIDARSPTGTIEDVKHVVILMQENRSFDHYFGTMNGVRGFGDRFPIPVPGGAVWRQSHTKAEPSAIAPFPLNTTQTFAHMRVEGTPHSWSDAQYAWDNGRMTNWPDHKRPHAMGYFTEADIPFQWALANAFTLCDAYHCSFQGGTNTNRLFLWSGTNDGGGTRGGPSISNSHDTLPEKGGAKAPYTWTTYPERLEAAGISWKIYEDMADNFGDNPLVGFKAFRDSLAGTGNPALAAKGLSTQHLDVLKADVMAGTLPSVSWVISPAKDSEHPGPSSPAQGADYIARVLEALTSNPDVWAQTVLLVNFDENDGFFDHAPPPAPPTIVDGVALGGSTVDAAGEYHAVRAESEKGAERDDLMGRPYGLGPRVPMYVISPFSRGGWVNSQVFDHTSVIRFLEARFGVMEPNISAWRRAVCGDLTSCFAFKAPNAELAALPATAETADRAAALPKRTTPATPEQIIPPAQVAGVRRSRALPYAVDVALVGEGSARLEFRNTGSAAAVFHVHDLKRIDAPPRRYTVEALKTLTGEWDNSGFDLFVSGPNGFHRRFRECGVAAALASVGPKARLRLTSLSPLPLQVSVSDGAYGGKIARWDTKIPAGATHEHVWDLTPTSGWYDLVVTVKGREAQALRLAGRIETGADGLSDPAMGGPALMQVS
ncbi:MAG: phospholipase C, phosphocholine-specific [Hyphomonadaceae bacterium]